MPPEVIGRTGLLDGFGSRWGQDAGQPGVLMITGGRGIGKTVMLGVAQDLARRNGWEVISETATAGVAGRLGESIRRLAKTRFVVSHQVGLGDIGIHFLRQLQEDGSGLAITIDEIHAVGRDDLVQLGAAFQAFAGEGLPVVLVVAGLPAEVSQLLDTEPASFLRKADRIVLRNVTVVDVAASFGKIFAAGGLDAQTGIYRRGAEATEGYPFMVQLVGYFLWREAEEGKRVDASSVARAIERATKRLARTVAAPKERGQGNQNVT